MVEDDNGRNVLAQPPPVEEQVLLEWTCHPMKRRPAVTAAVLLFMVLLAALVYVITASRFMTVLALIILFASLAKFFMPTTYRFLERRIAIKTTMQTSYKEWRLFRSYYPDRNGVLLSPFAGPSRLENFRGIYVMFNENRDDVLRIVKTRIQMNLDREKLSSPQEPSDAGQKGTT
jgi:hypothetical protein